MLLELVEGVQQNGFWNGKLESKQDFLYAVALSLAKGNKAPKTSVDDLWGLILNLAIDYEIVGKFADAEFVKRVRELVFQTVSGSLEVS